ncbi:MAG: Ig-like domain-containing protein, partial [Verrucomicrobia bacterium]|nr:Ig-like domain-containing protein [Verrucomicrobiota bacterium]
GRSFIYSTYIGGPTDDQILGLALDSSGNVVVAGWSAGTMPVTAGAAQTTKPASDNGFVAKLNNDLTTLVYCTYVGGSSDDYLTAVGVESSGCAYVTGYSDSNNYPTTAGAFSRTLAGGSDVVVTKVAADGRSFIYSTYIGGVRYDQANAIYVSPSGSVWVAGTTGEGYPVTPDAFQTAPAGSTAVSFVTNLNSAGSAISYSSCLYGSRTETARSLTMGTDGGLVIVGDTTSPDFPVSSGAFQKTAGGGLDASLTATLKSGSTGISGETVEFKVDGTAVGTAITNASGVATFSYTVPANAALGSHTIVASFAGDTDYAASSGSGSLTVSKITTSLAAADASGVIGSSATLTATLTAGGSGVSGKTISFTVDGATVGSGTTDASGVASFSYSIPSGTAAGDHAVAASFDGDTTYESSSATATLT